MSTRNPQVLDPLGAVASWAIVPVSVVLVLGYVAYSTSTSMTQVSSPALLAVSLALIIVACLAFVWRSLPRRAPFSRGWFIGILGLAALADIAYVGASWGLNRLVQDDWGQVAVAILLLASSRLRPPLELLISGLVAAVLLGAVASLQWSFLTVHSNPLLYAVVVGTPILALGCGAAAYGHEVAVAAERWRASATDAMDRLRPELRETAARTVQQEQVTLLNSAAVPLLEEVLRRDAVTDAQVSRAAAIATELRHRAVGVLDRSWLAEALVGLGAAADVDFADALDDPDSLAEAMTLDQRAVVRAALAALSRRTEVRLDSVTVQIGRAEPGRPGDRSSAGAWFELEAELHGPAAAVSQSLAPYRDVLRVVAWRAELAVVARTVTLGFWYECP